MRNISILFRAWYYFRLGYGTYLSFLFGYVTTLVTVYYLAVKNLPSLFELFPKFALFGAIAVVSSVPICVGLGWMHTKRLPAFRSEVDISVEANPYNYKLPPGYVSEVFYPLLCEISLGVIRLMEKEKLLDDPTRTRFEDLLAKLDTLLKGGYIGKPRARM